jgi:hypothetical protein
MTAWCRASPIPDRLEIDWYGPRSFIRDFSRPPMRVVAFWDSDGRCVYPPRLLAERR